MNFIDLFAGIGGIRLGLEQAGMHCLGYVEIDKFARESYQAEFDTKNEWTASDIRSVTDADWRKFRNKVNVIAGGFPCQTFSIAGKRKAFTDTTKGTLFFEVARALENVRPKYFILENVKGLLSSKTFIPFQDAMTILNAEFSASEIHQEETFSKKDWKYLLDNLSVLIADLYESSTVEEKEQYEQDPDSWLNGQIAQDMALVRTQQQAFPKLFVTSSEWDISDMISRIRCRDLPTLEILQKLIGTERPTYLSQALYEKISVLPSLFFLKRHPDIFKQLSHIKQTENESNYYVQTFNIIIDTLCQLGYSPEWRVFNSKDFGVPQNRERIIIVGSLGDQRAGQILPTEGKDPEVNPAVINDLLPISNPRHGRRGTILGDDGISSALAATDYKLPKQVLLNADQLTPVNPNRVKQVGNLSSSKSFAGNPQAGRVYDPAGLSPTLNTMQGGDRQPKIIQNAHGFNHGGLHDIAPTLTRSSYEMNNFVFNKLADQITVRKLTPLECWRLQGFPDSYFKKAQEAGISNSQLYKQAGNSVTVPLFHFVGQLIADNDHIEKEL